MATNVMSLSAEMGLDARKFSGGLADAKEDMRKTGNFIEGEAENTARGVDDAFSGLADEAGQSFNLMESLAVGAFTGMTTFAIDTAVAIGASFADTFKDIALLPGQLANEFEVSMDRLSVRTGQTGEDLEALEGLAIQVFEDAFGDSIEDAASAVAMVDQRFKDLSGDEIVKITENAFALQDAFGEDMSSSIDAVQVLMDEMGLTSDEAFGFITKGMQDGLNRSGDFLDTIREYSNQFNDAGFDAQEFYSILESGAAGGVLGTDKAADAVKEFQIRMSEMRKEAQEGGGTLSSAFSTVTDLAPEGIDFAYDTAEAFDQVIAGLREMRDNGEDWKSVATDLFGTQAEDLGDLLLDMEAAPGMMQDWTKATDQLADQYDNLPGIWTSISRQFQTSLLPIGDTLLEALKSVMPDVENTIGWFETDAVPILQGFAEQAVEWFQYGLGWIRENGIPLAQGFFSWLTDIAMPQVVASWNWWNETASPAIAAFAEFALAKVGELYLWFVFTALPEIASAWEWWNAEALPAITTFADAATTAITPIFNWLIEEGLPMVQEAWMWWQEEALPMLQNVFGTSQEGWGEFFTFLVEKWQEIQPQLTEAWTTMQESWAKITEVLGPVVENLGEIWAAYQRVLNVFAPLAEALGLSTEQFTAMDAVIGTLGLVIDVMVFNLDIMSTALEGIALGMEEVSGWISYSLDGWKKWGEEAKKAGDLVPDFLKPGSPPPLATAFKDIAEGARSANLAGYSAHNSISSPRTMNLTINNPVRREETLAMDASLINSMIG